MAKFSYQPTMRDSQEESTNNSSNMLDEWARSPDRKGWVSGTDPKHLQQIEFITNAIQSGQISEEGVRNLATRVKGLAPYIASAMESRKAMQGQQNLISQYVNPGSPAVPAKPFETDEEQQFGLSPLRGNISQEAKPEVPAVRNYQGAVDALASRGYVDLADKYKKLGGLDSASGRGEYYVPIQTAKGIYSFNARTGEVKDSGGNIVGSSSDPGLQAKLTEAKKTAEINAESKAKSNIDLPGIESSVEYSIGLLDQLKNHPGKKLAIGVGGLLPAVPGTRQADFIALHEQIKNKQFLSAVQQMRGLGQLSDAEGRKLGDAEARMQRAQTVESFDRAVDEYKAVLQRGISNSRKKAGSTKTTSQESRPRIKFLDLP